MNTELVNLYVERLLNEIGENAKARALLETQLKYMDNNNKKIQAELEEVKAELEELKENNKKRKPKEVNTP